MADTMKQVCNMLNIKKNSTAYHHQSIGSLENKLGNILAKYSGPYRVIRDLSPNVEIKINGTKPYTM